MIKKKKEERERERQEERERRQGGRKEGREEGRKSLENQMSPSTYHYCGHMMCHQPISAFGASWWLGW